MKRRQYLDLTLSSEVVHCLHIIAWVLGIIDVVLVAVGLIFGAD